MEREPEARAPGGAELPETSAAQNLNSAGLGARLRAERLRRGLSLEAVEAETQVRRRFLEAIEEGSWEHLPGPVYARGFVKLYARAVGLDPAALLRDFDAQVHRLARPRNPAAGSDGPGARARGAGAGTPERRPDGKGRASLSASAWGSLPDPLLRALEPARRVRTASLLAVVVVGAALTGTWLLTRPLESPRPALPSLGAMRPTAATPSEAVVPQSEQPAAPAPAPPVTELEQAGPAQEPAGSSQPAAGSRQEREPPGGSPEGPVRLTARVRERSWMEVFADGQLVFSRSAEAGEVITWEAREVLTVRFGRPEVVDLTLNGVDLGRAGTGVITRVFTAETARLSRPAAAREGGGRQGEARGF